MLIVLLWNVLQSYHDLKRDVRVRKEVYKTTELIMQFMCESTLYLIDKHLAYNFDLGLFCKETLSGSEFVAQQATKLHRSIADVRFIGKG